MSSIQQRLPKSRVNITLDVETNGAVCKKELPFKLLVLGNFCGDTPSLDLKDRQRISINKENFQQVLLNMRPSLALDIPNTLKQGDSELKVDLNFNSMKDFEPEGIAKQVPELAKLVAMRNLLKDFRATVSHNKPFRKAMEEILNNKHQRQVLKQELMD